MKRLSSTETNPRMVNDTIRKIQEIVDTTTTGGVTIRIPGRSTPLVLTETGATIDFGAAYGEFVVINSSSDAYGPAIITYAGSGSPAASDQVGYISFDGNDSDGNYTAGIARFIGYWADPTEGSEDSTGVFQVLIGGTETSVLTLGTTDTVGLSTVAHIVDFGPADASRLMVQNSSAGSGGPLITYLHDSASPTTNDIVGGSTYYSTNAADETVRYGTMYCQITDTTDGNEDGYLVWKVMSGGSPTAGGMTLGPGLVIGSPTDGDKGVGTLNAVGVYDDGTLLTCYGLSPDIDTAFFHAQAPDGEHGPLNAFLARLGTDYDPTTLAGQRKHVLDKKHLTPYPNPAKYTERARPSVGGWVQSGVEMDELLFTYICALEDRIERLEHAAV